MHKQTMHEKEKNRPLIKHKGFTACQSMSGYNDGSTKNYTKLQKQLGLVLC